MRKRHTRNGHSPPTPGGGRHKLRLLLKSFGGQKYRKRKKRPIHRHRKRRSRERKGDSLYRGRAQLGRLSVCLSRHCTRPVPPLSIPFLKKCLFQLPIISSWHISVNTFHGFWCVFDKYRPQCEADKNRLRPTKQRETVRGNGQASVNFRRNPER